jgi:hypothetical protein
MKLKVSYYFHLTLHFSNGGPPCTCVVLCKQTHPNYEAILYTFTPLYQRKPDAQRTKRQRMK